MTDKERMDWLELQDVEVRIPLVHGSRKCFLATSQGFEAGDDFSNGIRREIDKAMENPQNVST